MPQSESQIMNNPRIDPPWGTFTPSAPVRCWLRQLQAFPQWRLWRCLALWIRKPAKLIDRTGDRLHAKGRLNGVYLRNRSA